MLAPATSPRPGPAAAARPPWADEPRLINAVCDKALLAGFVEGTDLLTWRQVRRAIRELEGRFT